MKNTTTTGLGGGKGLSLLLCSLMLSLLLPPAWAQGSSISFHSVFKPSDPTSQLLGGINSIVQDSDGFIWLAGETGLGRYDGNAIKVYQANKHDRYALHDDYIRKLLIDRDGVIWVGTNSGLCRYLSDTDDFECPTLGDNSILPQEAVTALAVDKDNTLYAGGDKGLYILAPSRQTVVKHQPASPVTQAQAADPIHDIEIDRHHMVWLALEQGGLARFDPKDEGFTYFTHNREDDNSLIHNKTKALKEDAEGRLWVATYGGGVSVLSADRQSFSHFRHDPNDPTSLASNVVWDVFEDSLGIIWLAVDQGGLAKYNDATRSFHTFTHASHDPTSIISNQIRTVYEDANSDLWIGAFPSGVSFYNRTTSLFNNFKHLPNDSNSLSNNAVLNFLEDDKGTLWIGTEDGLNAFDPTTESFTRYMPDAKSETALVTKSVLSISDGPGGELWIGTWSGGLQAMNPETGRFRRITTAPKDNEHKHSAFIWDILKDSQGTMWLATEFNGVNRYDESTQSFTHYIHQADDEASIPGSFAWTLMEDSQQNLWVGTFSGLSLLDPETGKFSRFLSDGSSDSGMNSQKIIALYEDSRGLVWVGTQDRGVSIYNPKTSRFRRLGVEDGLPSKTVSSIIEDNEGDIWLSTTNGLVRVSQSDYKINVYNVESGLVGNNFNRNASFKDAKGNLYIGGTDGFSVFNPANLSNSNTAFPVVITGFRILNKDVDVRAEGAPTDRSIVKARQLNLSYKDIMFSFDFAALNYRNTSANTYAYKLVGFDSDWHYIGTRNSATYTNIAPGDYTFQVRAASADGVWSDVREVDITITPPPWRTWWAYTIYGCLLLMAVYSRNEYQKLRIKSDTYKLLSTTDSLTGILNREGIRQVIEGYFSNPETKRNLSLVLIDIDHFKKINDHLGHDTGDRVLQEMASLVRANVRSGDSFARWGGEEFLLLLPGTEEDSAVLLAEKLRSTVAQYEFDTAAKPSTITLSLGVAHIQPDETFEQAFKRTDTALYEAKLAGRNQVVLSQ